MTVRRDFSAADIDSLLFLDAGKLPQQILLSFEGVSFVPSHVITKLNLLNKELRVQGGKLRICNASPDVLDDFKLMKLNKSIDIACAEE